MKRFFLILATIFLFTTAGAYADKVITGTAEIYPPFATDANSSGGFAIEIVRSAFESQGYKLEVTYYPWARAMNEVTSGNYDVLINVWYTEERSNFLLYSDSYAENSVKFIKRKDDTFEYSSLDSLTGKKIGTIRKYGYGDDFLNATNFKKIEANSFIINLRKLITGRIDLTLEDELVARTIILNEAPSLIDEIKFTENELAQYNLYIAASLYNSNSGAVISIFNKGLKKIKSNGTLEKIYDSYSFKLN